MLLTLFLLLATVQSAIIRQMIRNMVAGGMSVEAVAQMVGKTPAEVRQLLDSAE